MASVLLRPRAVSAGAATLQAGRDVRMASTTTDGSAGKLSAAVTFQIGASTDETMEVDISTALGDLATAHALIAHLRGRAQRERGIDLDTALRPPPPEPDSCCGRGCNGCVWDGYYHALRYWCDDALALISAPTN